MDYDRYLDIFNYKLLGLINKYSNIIPTYVTSWDNTPRYGVRGILLKNVVWKHYPTTHTKNVYVTNVKEFVKDSKASTPVPGLQINGKRRTRARYPNLPGGIEVSPMYDNMISGGDATWTPPDFNKYGKVKFYTDNTTAHQRPGKLYIYIHT